MRLFDFEKNEYKHDALNAYLKTASQGERIMAQFAIGVWRGDNEFAFNFVEAAGYLDRNQIKVVAEWLIDPFWP